ncbi:MAG TPA: LysR family transcriptional regulator [Burkholderiaceae bacterium]|jgi:DNA-binding transcriptional LysR family regulator|nr:LysR family transcriptional regulator [Burkholderiaceae bacterium]
MAERNTFDPVTLRLFVAVCEERNIARAAEREAIVASAVSKRIAAIEAEVGAPLLVRGRRGIEPTAAGQALLRQAREVLSTMARMHAELSDFATGAQGSVLVLAAPSVLAEDLADDIGAFLTQHPRVRISLDERVSPDIVKSVREGTADLGVLWDLSDMGGLHTVPYRRDRLCLAAPLGHPLARRKRIAFTEALPHVNVAVAPGGMMDRLLQREAARLGQPLVKRIQVSSMDAAARIVAAGLGPAILPREAVQMHSASHHLALVPLTDAWAKRQFVICLRADGSTSAATRLLVEALRAAAAGG